MQRCCLKDVPFVASKSMDQNYVGSLSTDLEQYWLVVKKNHLEK